VNIFYVEKTVALNYQEKEQVVAEVSAHVAEAQTLVIAEYRGIAVGDLTRLRKIARESGVFLKVIKNTLVVRAIDGTPFQKLSDKMKGPLIYSMGADAVAPAKVLNDFAKNNDKIIIKAGMYNGDVLDEKAIKALASIPSREELLAQLVGVMQAPVAGFVRCLAAVAEQKTIAE
jgi:large subunit ribosomal protein L10